MQTSIDYIRQIFGNTEHQIHFCSLGNERDGKNSPRMLDTRNPDDLGAFISKWDLKDRGLFYCASTLKPGSHKRNKENVAELPILFADIDLKDVAESVEEIERKLGNLKHRPTLTIRSGNGVHAIWMLKEAVDLSADGAIADVEEKLRLLSDIVGGDLQVCEVARLMRLPGSHNSKRGGWKDVVVSHQSDARHELSDLEDWFGEQSPVILRKSRQRAITVGEAVDADPYLDHFKRNGLKPPTDVEKLLNEMMYMGGEANCIHATQIKVSASMLNNGVPVEDIVDILMAATRAAAGEYASRWNWRTEEKTIRRACMDWMADPRYTPPKSKRTAETRPQPDSTVDKIKPQPDTQSGDNRTQSGAGGAVVALKPKTKPAPKPEATDADANHIKIGGAVIGVIRSRGDDLIFTEKASWYCDQGLWRMMTDTGWLDVEIEKAIVALNYSSTLKLRSETRGWIKCQPSLWRNIVPWDQHGMVPTQSGLVDPRTLEARPLRPDDYATWRIEAEYDPGAKCPWWLTMLEDVFEDRTPEVRAQTISVIQEQLGAGMIDDKPRELSKALILQGGSNFGKSGLIEVLGGLFGKEQNSTAIESLEGAHGMMPFIKRMPWVLHEAFDQRKWHFSSAVKAIITGEPVPVNVKNGPMLSVRVTAPIFWGTNHPPQFREATKAIVNRLVVIECRREFDPEALVGAAAEAKARGLAKPSSLVLRDELPGLLTWALNGLRRALERGHLSMTNEMIEIGEAIRDDSNLVAGFLTECVVYDQDKRISAPDFCLGFGAWWLANKGESRQVPSNESIGKNLLAMADSMIAISNKELRDNTRRYYAGIALNEEGLSFHRAGYDLQELRGKTANATDPKGVVNSQIPDSWADKPSIIAMRKKHAIGMGILVTDGGDRCKPVFSHRSPVTDLVTDGGDSMASVTNQSPQQSLEENIGITSGRGLTNF